MLASLTCTLFSCGPDELIPESVPPVVNPGDKDEPGEEPEEPEEPEKIQLAITASLQDMQQTRGIIEAFAPGHEMGVFISTDRTDEAAGTKNASYLLTGKCGMPDRMYRWKRTPMWSHTSHITGK